jgi:hypothetical protein
VSNELAKVLRYNNLAKGYKKGSSIFKRPSKGLSNELKKTHMFTSSKRKWQMSLSNDSQVDSRVVWLYVRSNDLWGASDEDWNKCNEKLLLRAQFIITMAKLKKALVFLIHKWSFTHYGNFHLTLLINECFPFLVEFLHLKKKKLGILYIYIIFIFIFWGVILTNF